MIKKNLIIFLCSFLFIGLTIGGVFFLSHFMDKKSDNLEQISHKENKKLSSIESQTICHLFQRNLGKDRLKTAFLAQMLDLSIDVPKKISDFDVKKYTSQLSDNPIMEKIHIQKIFPSSLLIDYKLREPIALLANFQNTAVNFEGVLFPLYPFYSPKDLPEVVFGQELFHAETDSQISIWGKKIPQKRMKLVEELFKVFEGFPDLILKKIDLSSLDAQSYGQREIIITVLDQNPVLLRLTEKNLKQELANYFSLRKSKIVSTGKKNMIIDLRIPEVAYIVESVQNCSVSTISQL